MLPRRRAFKPGPEEYNLIVDVVQKYAIFKAGAVGFTLKRQVGFSCSLCRVELWVLTRFPLAQD